MEKRRKEAVRRHKIKEKSPFFPFTLLVLAVVKAAGWMLRVSPQLLLLLLGFARPLPALPGLCPTPMGTWGG